MLIYSGSQTEHEVTFLWVCDYLYEETLFVKYKMYEFGKDSVEYHGYIVGQGYLCMDPSKVQAINEWPEPKCTKHIQ